MKKLLLLAPFPHPRSLIFFSLKKATQRMTSVASTENLNFHSENDIFASEVGASSDGEGVGAAVAPKNDAAELVANSSSALSPFNNLKGIEEREEYSEAVQKETLIPANPLNHHRNLSQIPADVLSITSSIRNDYEYLTTATRETGTASENRNGADAAMDSSNDLREIRDLEFQLIPFTDDPNSKFPLEEVVDRKLKDGDSFKIGRLSSKDAYKKGMPTLDAWFNSKVVSRTHAELWWTGGQVKRSRQSGQSSAAFLKLYSDFGFF